MPCARFIIRGLVQGVLFRASAREQALELGISGHAINRADGSVEVLACGDAESLDALQRWLRVGPPSARVTQVMREALPEQHLRGFDIRN